MAATLTNVASSATSVTLISSNASRKSASIFNDSTQLLYAKCGSSAAATSCIVKVASMGFFEVPFGYTGIVTGIWVSANGYARVTEVT